MHQPPQTSGPAPESFSPYTSQDSRSGTTNPASHGPVGSHRASSSSTGTGPNDQRQPRRPGFVADTSASGAQFRGQYNSFAGPNNQRQSWRLGPPAYNSASGAQARGQEDGPARSGEESEDGRPEPK